MDNVTPQRVLELMVQELGMSSDLRPEDPIFSSRILDSIDVVNLVLVLEKAFGVRIDPSEVDIGHLDSAVRVAETLQRHREKQAVR
jgi:acyl carrier protein